MSTLLLWWHYLDVWSLVKRWGITELFHSKKACCMVRKELCTLSLFLELFIFSNKFGWYYHINTQQVIQILSGDVYFWKSSTLSYIIRDSWKISSFTFHAFLPKYKLILYIQELKETVIVNLSLLMIHI